MSDLEESDSVRDFVTVGIIGHPVRHSKSPLIHNYWIEKYDLRGSYEAFDIAPENLVHEMKSLVRQGYYGFNVTLPHKEHVFELCDEADDLARAVGAVNTITIGQEQIKGTNTDVFGFVQNILQSDPAFDFAAKKAVVLGAGGAAKAVVHGLLSEGTPEVCIVNRTRGRAEELAEASAYPSKVTVHDWIDRDNVLKGAGLLVNTTSLGMEGHGVLDISLKHLPKGALVNDIVYAPLYTELLKAAESRGNRSVTGIGMLLHQARPAFKAWFGIMPDIDDTLRKKVENSGDQI